MQQLADALERLVTVDRLYAETATEFLTNLERYAARPDHSDAQRLETFAAALVAETPIRDDELAALGRLGNALSFGARANGAPSADDPHDI